MKAKSLLLGFIAGGIAGGLTILFTAPASGKETIKNLQEHKDLWKKDLLELNNNLIELKDSVSSLTKEGKDGVSSFIQDTKILLESWKQDIEPNQKYISDELDFIQKTIQELETNLNFINK